MAKIVSSHLNIKERNTTVVQKQNLIMEKLGVPYSWTLRELLFLENGQIVILIV